MLRPLSINQTKSVAVVLATLAINYGSAREISPQEALERYIVFAAEDTRATTNGYKLAFTAMSDSEEYPVFYTFSKSNGNGFVVLSADDCLRPILGYTDSGNFNQDNLSPALKWMLEGYKKEISYAQKNKIINNSISTRREDREAIPPLVSTKWDQGVPTVSGNAYNARCPRIGNKKCYTGCVPTSVAQVMNYHRWPETHGNGSWQYKWTYNQNGNEMSRELSFDFENTTFDWENMLSEYDDNADSAQQAAVAELMYACGVALEAIYGTSETGAYSTTIPDALRTYFNYDSMAHYLLRDFFSTEEWEEIIYNELRERRPVIYAGSTKDDGAHSFVCDGYDGNGLFHINWGWGGLSDGFFALSALNPNDQGTGSYEGGYNYMQDAVIGVQPPVAGNEQVFSSLYVLDGSFEMSSLPDINGDMQFKFPGWLTNGSLFRNTYSLGVKIIDEAGDEVGIMESLSGDVVLDGYVRGNSSMEWGKDQLIYNYSFKTSAELYYNLPAGQYTLMPVYKTTKMNWNQLYTDSAPHIVTINKGESGIDNVNFSGLTVSVEGGEIYVSGAAKNENVSVYSVSGKLVAHAEVAGEYTRLNPGGKGIYIVKCGSTVRKVIIK